MARIWKRPVTVETITRESAQSVFTYLGMEYVEVGDDYIKARAPVDERTRQPYGVLHGGVSVVLAETLGSHAAELAAEPGSRAMGVDINASHLRAVTEGWVTGTVRPVRIGRTLHVWQIEIVDDDGRPTCVSRITVAIQPPKT